MRNDLNGLKEYKSPPSDFVNLANNENYYSNFLHDHSLEINEIVKNLSLSSYGPDIHHELTNTYASYANVKKENVLVGPGSEVLITLLFQALTTRSILSLDVDFYRYEEVCQIIGRQHITIPFENYTYDSIIEKSKKENVEMIIMSNPHNPYGIKHNISDLKKIIENVDCYVVVDEAYWEFSDESIMNYLDKYDNLIVLRTVSKAWGLAGLRVGFVIASKEIISFLNLVQGPFVVSPLNAAIANLALKYKNELDTNVSKIIIERDKLENLLEKYNIKYFKSNANFVYLEDENALAIKNYLYENKYLVNYFAENGLRITIGTSQQMLKLIELLDNYFKKAESE